jgi:hypothetical protein
MSSKASRPRGADLQALSNTERLLEDSTSWQDEVSVEKGGKAMVKAWENVEILPIFRTDCNCLGVKIAGFS